MAYSVVLKKGFLLRIRSNCDPKDGCPYANIHINGQITMTPALQSVIESSCLSVCPFVCHQQPAVVSIPF